MITYKKDTLKKFKNWSDESIHILTDFDRTITTGNSDSSWSILSKSNEVPKEYIKDRMELYNYYRPIEIDSTIDFETRNLLIQEWFIKHLELFIKYKMSEKVINEAINDPSVMTFRDGAKEFLEELYKRNIPVIIISAGIGNFIKQFLIKNNCNFNNIHIIANFIKFENGITVGFSEKIIHSFNKNEVSLENEIKEKIINRPNVILLGDSISDIKMISEDKKENALKIGFLEEKIEENKKIFEEQFDVVCTNNTSYNKLRKTLNI